MQTVLSVGLSNAVTACGLALVALGVGKWWRRPAVAHGLWLLVLIKLLTPPVLPLPVSWPQTSTLSPPQAETVGSALTSSVAGEEGKTETVEVVIVSASTPPVPSSTDPAASLDGPTLIAMTSLLGVWALGTVSWLTVAVVRSRRFRRLLRFAEPAPPTLQDRVARLAGRLGMRSGPAVWLLPGRLSPMIWPTGGAAAMFLPAALLPRLSPEQFDALLVHELAHLKRKDHWVRTIEFLATALYWWHPVVWWARREMHEAEEQCCDAWVVWALPGSQRAYALALVETVDFLSEARPSLPSLASGVGYVHDLKRRVTMIMKAATPRLAGWAGLLLLLGLAVVVLPLLPVLAQADRESAPPAREDDRKPADRKPEGDKGPAEIKELEEKLTDLRAKVREVEQQLDQARRRVGDRREHREEERVILRLQGADGKVQTIELPPGTKILTGGPGGPGGQGGGGPPMGGGGRGGVPGGPGAGGQGGMPPGGGGPGGPPPGAGRPGGGVPGGGAPGTGPAGPGGVPGGNPPMGGGRGGPPAEGDLQRKIEDLTRQVEELRRQLQKPPEGGPRGGGDPGLPKPGR